VLQAIEVAMSINDDLTWRKVLPLSHSGVTLDNGEPAMLEKFKEKRDSEG